MPPYSFRETYPNYMYKTKKLGGGYGAVGGATAPLGTLTVASVLRSDGHDVSFVDGIFFDEEQWLNEIIKSKPEIVGINSSSMFWERTKRLAKILKKNIPGVKIAVGGTHVTAIGHNALKEKDSNGIDFIFLGESEYTSREFLSCFEKGKLNRLKNSPPKWEYKDIWQVSTVCWRKGKKIMMMKKQKPPQNLDKLPYPARDITPFERYCPSIGFYKRSPTGTIMTSRGCPFNCNFCASKRIYRERSPESVINEIKYLVENFKVKHIIFYDNNIAYNKPRLEKICDMMIKEELDLDWCAQSRVTDIDEKILKKMKDAGCWEMCFGIETGSNKFLANIRKGTNPESIIRAVNLTKQAGIEVFGAFMLGIPGETIRDMEKTVEFACKLPLDYVKFNIFTPFPDSRDYHLIKDSAKKVSDKFTQHHVTYEFDGLKKDQIEEFVKESYWKFYSRPKYLLKRLFSTRSVLDLNRNFRGFMAFLIKKDEWAEFIP